MNERFLQSYRWGGRIDKLTDEHKRKEQRRQAFSRNGYGADWVRRKILNRFAGMWHSPGDRSKCDDREPVPHHAMERREAYAPNGPPSTGLLLPPTSHVQREHFCLYYYSIITPPPSNPPSSNPPVAQTLTLPCDMALAMTCFMSMPVKLSTASGMVAMVLMMSLVTLLPVAES